MVRWICVAFLVLALPAVASAAPALDGSFTVSGIPKRLTLGPDGNVWFTLENSSDNKEFGKITPTGQVTEFDTPNGELPIGITTGPDGKLWLTAPGNVIDFAPNDPGGATAHPISDIIQAQTIVAGPDGNLWTGSADKIFKITTSGTETHYTVTDLTAHGIAAGGDGNLWVADFTGPGGTNGRIIKAPTTGSGDPTTKFDATGGQPQEIAAGPTGQLGFTQPTAQPQYVGRIDFAGNVQKTTLPNGTDPFGIAFGNDGAYWTPQFGANSLGRTTTAGVHTDIPLGAGTGPRYITRGADNTLWVGLETVTKIARITGVSAPPSLPALPPSPAAVADTVAPGITTYSLSSKVIRPFTSGASIAAKVTRGTRVTYTLTEAATATFTVQRLLPGRTVKVKRRTHCVRPTRKNAKRRKCTRVKRAGSFTRVSTPGANSFTFTGRVNGKRLGPGRYRLRLVARDAAGNASKARLLRFRVVK